MLLVLSCDPVGSMDSMGPVVPVGPVDLVGPLGAKGSMVAVGAALLWCDSWMVLWSVGLVGSVKYNQRPTPPGNTA